MPNLILFRRGSATPSAGAFTEGEPAWDSTNKRLFVKAADGSMAEIGGIPISNDTSTNATYYPVFSATSSGAATLKVSSTKLTFNPLTGAMGLGGSTAAGVTLNLGKDATGAANYTSVNVFNTIKKDVTSGLISFSSFPALEATPFTLPFLYHSVAGQSALGSGPILTLQTGYRVYSSLTGGNTNIGFASNLAAPVAGPAGPFTVSTISSSGTTVTVNTTGAHSLVNGQMVSVSALVNATALVSGVSCVITTLGTTDYTAIGAASNTVGLSFTATGAGTGTGTVTLNCQGGGVIVAGSSGTSFTYTATVSATFAAVTVATGVVTVSKRYNFYSEGSADNYYAGNTGFGVLSPTQKIDVLGSGLFRAGSNQDGVLISGRAGGSSAFNATLTPGTLTASQTLTLPDKTGTIATLGDSSTGLLRPPAGLSSADGSPLKFTSGTNLTTPEAGTVEYDGTHLYATPLTALGRGHAGVFQTFRLTANGSNIGPAIGDYFGSTSAISLSATSVYEIEFFAFLQKNTAGTLTWTLTASSAPTLISGLYRSPQNSGIAAGAPLTGYAGSRNAATAAFVATASITAAAFMVYEFHVRVITNAATSFKLQVTNSAGTVTPQAGSFYTVRQVSGTTGAFV